MFKDDYELDGVAISSYGSIDVENAVIDANCAALSEVYFGQAQDIKDMAFFVIGTGVGGAISQRDDFVEQLMGEYNKIREKIGMDVIIPNLKCCTYRQDANLLGALANYIGRNKQWAEMSIFSLFRDEITKQKKGTNIKKVCLEIGCSNYMSTFDL